jgi:hypothetical protein
MARLTAQEIGRLTGNAINPCASASTWSRFRSIAALASRGYTWLPGQDVTVHSARSVHRNADHAASSAPSRASVIYEVVLIAPIDLTDLALEVDAQGRNNRLPTFNGDLAELIDATRDDLDKLGD